MKIAIVLPPHETAHPTQHNSSGLWSQQVAKRLSTSADITLFSRRNGQQRASFRENSVNYRFVRDRTTDVIASFGGVAKHLRQRNAPLFNSVYYGMSYATKIARIVRRERFDIVHVHNHSNLIPTIRLLNPRIGIVLHMNQAWLSQLNSRIMARRLAQCNRVIANSKQLRDSIRAAHPQYADRVTHINNGVDTEYFRPSEAVNSAETISHEREMLRSTKAAMTAQLAKGKTEIDQTVFATLIPEPSSRQARIAQPILCVGDFSPENGLHDLIDAFVQISAHVPQATLEFYGRPITSPAEHIITHKPGAAVQTLSSYFASDYVNHLLNRVPTHLKSRVIFHEQGSTNELLTRYRDCAIAVNASYSGGYNVSIAEAGACGKPSITTSADATAGITIDGETGFVFEPGDVHMLARALGVLLHDINEQGRMGRNARVRAKYLFDWNDIAKSTLSVYQRVLEQRQTRRKAVAA